jgi:glycogen operon protein
MHDDLLPGQAYPLGATIHDGGVNFCVFSKNCTAVELLLFDDVDAAGPARVIRLDPGRNRTFYYWHVLIPGIRAGQLYAYRVYGPFAPEEGHRYDGTKVLLDPYARAVASGRKYDRNAARGPGDNAGACLKGVVIDPRAYNWGDDEPLHRPLGDTVIYEMHVGGFTLHPISGVAPERRGTFAGMIEKLPYLKDLGVTAIELLPVQHFDDDGPSPNPLPSGGRGQGEGGLRDYWGYNPISFFAPHGAYSSNRTPLGPADEFRDMVKACHRAGIEVILDMVFNHTSEGDGGGPTLSFRGFENRAYYLLDPANRALYANYTGCGNTVNGNHSIVRRMIRDCLHHWVQCMHVDGFRFDLASVLARDEDGKPLKSPPILWEIESDPVLAGCKLIAEAWDAAGLYQVGTFIGHRWAEWNGQFRDDVRRFIKGDTGMVRKLAQRLAGSPDLYPQPDRDPHRSVNFVTCHDGFTLNDLVSYNVKHNEANGEKNRDGSDSNFSWNCGVEGPVNTPSPLGGRGQGEGAAIEELRQRQVKNFLVALLTAHGTPMFVMGDEARRSQRGNNNAYCQANELSWFDWAGPRQHEDLARFVQTLIRFRRGHHIFHCERFWGGGEEDQLGMPKLTWHGVRAGQPDLGDDSHSMAFELESADGGEWLYVIFNAYWEPLRFTLPGLPSGRRWLRVVDTAQPSPADIAAPGQEVPVGKDCYEVAARSAVILRAERVER